MNDTEQLFIAAAIWTLIAAVVARVIPNWPGRIVFLATAVGLPFWELPYGYYNFQELCRKEMELKVFEKIAPQQIVCADYPFVTLHEELLTAGFSVVEVRGKTGEIRRYMARPAGGTADSVQQSLESKYCLTFANNNQMPWRVLRHDQLITRAHDRRAVARQSRFSWQGMWWQEALSPLLGRGGDCFIEKNHSIVALRNGAG
jgi:hypothetical protein